MSSFQVFRDAPDNFQVETAKEKDTNKQEKAHSDKENPSASKQSQRRFKVQGKERVPLADITSIYYLRVRNTKQENAGSAIVRDGHTGQARGTRHIGEAGKEASDLIQKAKSHVLKEKQKQPASAKEDATTGQGITKINISPKPTRPQTEKKTDNPDAKPARKESEIKAKQSGILSVR